MEPQIGEVKREISLSTSKKHSKVEDSKSCPYVSKLMHYPAKDPYSLPIPEGEIRVSYSNQNGIYRSGFPPFIARQDSLLTLLTNAYESHYGPKPIVTLITTCSGSGKSRTLIEWAVQVFQQPAVVHAFLQQQEIDVTVQQDIVEQIMEAWKSGDSGKKVRAKFLVKLHRTMRESTVISVPSFKVMYAIRPLTASVTEAQVRQACTKIMEYALRTRFKGKATKEVPFDDVAADLSSIRVTRLIKLYFELVEESVPPYAENKPIVTDPDLLKAVINEGRSLFINIDELQELLPIKSLVNRSLRQTKNLLHEIAHAFNMHSVAGLYTGPIKEIEDTSGAVFFLRPSIPLDPLLKIEHLNKLCKEMFDRCLYNAKDPTSLPKALSLQLYRMWITTCGNPRSIECFGVTLVHDHEKMISNIKHNSGCTLSKKDEFAVYHKILEYTHFDFESLKEHNLGLNDLEFSKFIIDVLFGITKEPNEPLGKSWTYDDGEGRSWLMPQYFIPNKNVGRSAHRNYTIPFFMYSKGLDKEFPGMSNNLSSLVNPHKIQYDEIKNTIGYAINALGGKLYQSNWIDEEECKKFPRSVEEAPAYTTQILETSTAVHTWFRYLQATNMEHGKLVPCSDVIPSAIVNSKAFGVVALHTAIGFTEEDVQTEGFKECIDFLFTNKLIAVNKSGSSFSDVIVPLYDAEGKPQNILCIQCRDVMPGHSKVKASHVYNEANKILSASEKFIYVLLSPNVSKADITYRSKKANQFKTWEENGKFFISNGDGWLSEWFLRIFREKCQLLNK